MIFSFLKYIQPVHYFSLKNIDNVTVFPITEKLPKEVLKKLKKEESFKSDTSKQYDLSWQAIQKGYIGKVETYKEFEKLPLEDEYRFIKKYFNKLWRYYVLVIRLFTFHNPVNEIRAFIKAKTTSKVNIYKDPIISKRWDLFEGQLLQSQPKVTVVIPTLNRYEYLKDVLRDLENQTYKNFDVIVVDQSEPFKEVFYKNFELSLDVVYQEEKALWLARNTAIKKSDADYILLFDDDSRVKPNWVKNHLKCLDFFNVFISSGTSISLIGADVPLSYSYLKISDQIDTGNVMIHKNVFKEIGLFDRQFEKQRMGDSEFGLRSYLAGYLNISNPFAQRLHLKVGTGGLRQMGSWDGFRPKNWFGPRPIPSVLYLFRKYFGSKLTKLAILKMVPPSLVPYKYKKHKNLMLFTYISIIIIWPIILVQILKSWKLATVKLKKGALIEKI